MLIVRQLCLGAGVPAMGIWILAWSVLHVLGAFSEAEVLHIASAVSVFVGLLLLAQLLAIHLLLHFTGQTHINAWVVLLSALGLQVGAWLAIRRILGVTEPIHYATYLQAAGLVSATLGLATLAWSLLVKRVPALKRPLHLAFSTTLLVFLVSCASFATIELLRSNRWARETPSGKKVILITVDSFRYDRSIGVKGRSVAPNILAFADQANVFERFIVHAPYTWTSLASMLTSTESPMHGVRVNGQVLAEDQLTVAEVLSTAGYLCYSPGDLGLSLMGLDQGLAPGLALWETGAIRLLTTLGALSEATVAPSIGEYGFGQDSSVATTLRGLAFLQQHRTKPFFLWIHYYDDPHAPYYTPAFYEQRFAGHDGQTWITGSMDDLGALNGVPPFSQLLDGRRLTRADLTHLSNLYDAEVAVMDYQVGRVFEVLRATNQLERSLIIVTADHGEDLNERGHFLHSNNLYDELVHVPLIIKNGPNTRRRVQTRLVRGIDIAPTILDFVDVEAPSTFRGRSLLELPSFSVPSPEEWSYSETLLYGRAWPYDQFAFAYTSNANKVVFVAGGTPEEVFCSKDGRYERCEADAAAAALAMVDAKITTYFGLSELRDLVPQETVVIGAEQERMLRELGYLP